MTANICGIIKSSVIDGPGNRMVIFFQSCQFDCLYCHNSHTIGTCNMCGICVDNCPTGSLSLDKKNSRIIHNKETCIKCDRCIEKCPQSSNPFYRQYRVDELIEEITDIKDFISGITVSGGEVMLQQPFLKKFFMAIRQNQQLKDLSILVDSNGCFDKDRWTPLIDLTDGFMIDIKAISAATHLKITGQDNEKVLNSILYLDSIGKLHEVRTVVVPGFNDTPEEVKALANFLGSLSPKVRKVLIKMRKHGIRKKYQFLKSPTQEHMQYIWEQMGDPSIRII